MSGFTDKYKAWLEKDGTWDMQNVDCVVRRLTFRT